MSRQLKPFTLTADEALKRAMEYKLANAIPEAEGLYRRILEENPAHPDANHNLGLLSAQSGQMDSALLHFKAALEGNPDCDQYWLSYVDALGRSGRFQVAGHIVEQGRQYGLAADLVEKLQELVRRLSEATLSGRYAAADYAAAERLARDLIQLDAGHGYAWKVLGASLLLQKRPSEALLALNEAVRQFPDDGEAYYNRGIGLKATGAMDEAEASYKKAIELCPEVAEYHNNLANLHYEMGLLTEAETNFRRALEIKPDYAAAKGNLGNLLRDLGHLEEAESLLRDAVKANPDSAMLHGSLGGVLNDQGRLDEAESVLRQAIGIDPQYAEAWNDLGNLLGYRGNSDEAVACFERALTIKPELAVCYLNFGRARNFTTDDPHIPILRQIVQSAQPDNERMYASFALGKACEDIGKYDEAFSWYSEGNRLRKKALSYSIEQDQILFAQVRSAFGKLPEIGLTVPRGIKPILVVGMPRSGTSLVEQILASHSMVHGAGELELLGHLVIRHFLNVPELGLVSSAKRMTADYFQGMDKIANGQPYVTDKMPLNFRWLGFLLLATPDIRIVHIQRDPVATCWSNFKEYFPARGTGFTCDLSDLAAYYKLYEDLMRFWHEKFPGRIYDLNYERLTENQEEETRKLLDYCGLPWEDSCLNFHETQRVVKTASASQVRKRLYQGSSAAWRKFENHLVVLTKALNPQSNQPG